MANSSASSVCTLSRPAETRELEFGTRYVRDGNIFDRLRNDTELSATVAELVVLTAGYDGQEAETATRAAAIYMIMAASTGIGWDLLLLGVCASHVLFVPYTKVEESFNLQAVHDLLYHRLDLASYDHLAFPGVVPRTFLGAIALAAASRPLISVNTLLGGSKASAETNVRIVLGALLVGAFSRLRRVLHRRYGSRVAAAFIIITAVQFHLPFYMTRTLPNTFALALTTLGLADWMAGNCNKRSVALLTFAAVAFRCDVLLLLGPVGLIILLSRRLSVLEGIGTGIRAVLVSLTITVLVDSVFWRRWLWPEGEVLWFNTALNKSAEWGVMPWHWYWTSALPRALLGALPLSILGGALERRVRPLLIVAVIYVFLYSFLGHKEVRFLFPVLPLFNIAAAVGLTRLRQSSGKSLVRRLLFLGGLGLLACTLLGKILMLTVSRHNYPGGHALADLHNSVLHEMPPKHSAPYVHIDVLPAMTGVSRFGELPPPWRYSKEEDLSEQDLLAGNYTHLLSAKPTLPGFHQTAVTYGFRRLQLTRKISEVLQNRSIVKLHLQPQVYSHERDNQMYILE